MYKFKLILYEWGICVTDDLEKLLVNGTICSGSVHYKDREIYLNSNLDEVDLYKTIRHELTHAVLYETQLNLQHSYSEEDLCELLAKWGEFIVNLAKDIINKLLK